MKRLMFYFTFCLLAFFSGLPTGHADGLSFTASPMMADVEALPGESRTGAITIRYEGAAPSDQTVKSVAEKPVGGSGVKTESASLHLRVYLMDWTLDSSGNPSFFPAGTREDSCANWIQINPVELTIPAGASRSVRYTLRVPEKAQGTSHCMVMFEADPTAARVDGQRVAIRGRIGSAIYAHAGSQTRRARITACAATLAATSLTLNNTGTAPIRFRGTVTYRDEKNRTVAQTALPGGVVLPGKDSIRNLRWQTPSLPKDAVVTATVIVDYGGEVVLGARCRVTNTP